MTAQRSASSVIGLLDSRVAKLCERVISLCEEHRADLVLSLIVSVALYGSFLFVPGFHIDDELSSVYGYVKIGVSFGRWGISLIRLSLIPGPFNAYFTMLFALLALTVTAVMFASVLDLSRFERRAAACLYIAFPQFCYQIEFHVQADVVPIGYILAVTSFVLLLTARRHKGGRRAGFGFGSVLLMVLSLAIYQPNFVIVPALCLLYSLRSIVRGEEINATVRFAAVCLLTMSTACVFYLAVSRVVLQITGIPGSSSYFVDQFVWDKQPVAQTIQHVLSKLSGIADGTSYYGESLYAFLLFPAVLILYSSFRSGMVRGMLSAALLLGLLICPYALVIVLGSPQPGRTFVAQPFVFAGVWAIGLDLLASRLQVATYRVVASVTVVAFLLSGTFFSSRLAFADYIQWKADVSLGTRIVDSVYRKYTFFDPRLESVYFYGNHKQPDFWRKPSYDVFGASFFDWGVDSTDRIDTFLLANELAGFHAPAMASREPLKLAVRKLPCWPNPDSILLVGDVLLVHLSD